MRPALALLLATALADAQEFGTLAEATFHLEDALAKGVPAGTIKAMTAIPALFAKADDEAQRKAAVDAVGRWT